MTDNAAAFGALSGIKIIDLTQMLAGPFGTMLLADHGATVIKVEPPVGDLTRPGGPFRDDDTQRVLGGYFQSVDRNKYSICLDLKTERGREAFKQLVRDSDAVVENFRAGVMERLGLGYEVLREINPRLVYGALRGFGDARTGASPYLDWPAFDVVAQAMGGIMAITGPDQATPTKVGPGVGDIIPGMMLGFGVLAAVYHAKSTGVGQFVDVAMTDAVLAVCERTIWQNSVQGLVPGPEGNHHPFLCPFGMFPAKDGFVTIAAQQDVFFPILCRQLDAPELSTDSRFSDREVRKANRLVLIELVSARTRKFTKAELMKRLGGKIPFGPVMDITDVLNDEHFKVREMLVDVENPGTAPVTIAGVPIKMTHTPGQVARRAPILGEHTRQLLLDAGVSESEVELIMLESVPVKF
ncbi:CaiB/BaiF CoA transferase family protein [Rhizorhapis suberifaciens]|uniref:Crotonobetainyl-CoA:carnitine CoA-transferase CaiB-like acyl-CoA transferase n=1 Tax=Rhizorhapis suberifaciens TaxID=13656 RepID=A0A840HV61_9SPHN|nr:CoA transferase [Rhizorhapis suberifaciens]MBB4642182.1 crotonobetainyl-CoA:carnitine CoA-transferase CaiB-like acyl-CoA transferase [Rhizorhapis suberifaciens]